MTLDEFRLHCNMTRQLNLKFNISLNDTTQPFPLICFYQFLMTPFQLYADEFNCWKFFFYFFLFCTAIILYYLMRGRFISVKII